MQQIIMVYHTVKCVIYQTTLHVYLQLLHNELHDRTNNQKIVGHHMKIHTIHIWSCEDERTLTGEGIVPSTSQPDYQITWKCRRQSYFIPIPAACWLVCLHHIGSSGYFVSSVPKIMWNVWLPLSHLSPDSFSPFVHFSSELGIKITQTTPETSTMFFYWMSDFLNSSEFSSPHHKEPLMTDSPCCFPEGNEPFVQISWRIFMYFFSSVVGKEKGST